MRYCPIAALSQELVKFDMQHMDNPVISGVEYQQGELQGYEVREYLLEKWQRKCAYCGAKDIPLQVEHIVARTNGGTDRISNLTIACESCNQKKGNQLVEVFLKDKPDVLKRILAQAKSPLKDAAAVNTTRYALYERLKAFGLPIECGSGGRTKYNRARLGLEKTHWLDAACVGASTPDVLLTKDVKPLRIKAMGHGHRHMVRVDGYGFPMRKGKDERPISDSGRVSGRSGYRANPDLRRQKIVQGKLTNRPVRRMGKDQRPPIAPRRHKRIHGFQTGDSCRIAIPTGPHLRVYVRRITVQSNGTFYFGAGKERISFSWKYCRALHRNDGYAYGSPTTQS